MKAHGGRRSAPLPRDWKVRRRIVLEAARFVCASNGCNRRATDVDHIVPAAEGGGDEISNLQALCAPCHLQKTGREAARIRAARFSRFREPEAHPGIVGE